MNCKMTVLLGLYVGAFNPREKPGHITQALPSLDLMDYFSFLPPHV